MQPIFSAFAITAFLSLALAGLPPSAGAATLASPGEADRIVSLQDVTISESGEVTGEVVNHSRQTLRDVQLQILHSWRWKNEFRPGTDDPGRAVYYAVDEEIASGQSVRFTYKPSPPLPSRTDGYFENSVSIAGFAQVFQPFR